MKLTAPKILFIISIVLFQACSSSKAPVTKSTAFMYGDPLPDASKCRSPGKVERPTAERRLPRRAVDAKSANLSLRVLEISNTSYSISQCGPCGNARSLKRPIVVSCDDDFASVRQRVNPLSEIRDLAQAAVVAHVARKEEDVALGYGDVPVQAVGVAEADELHAERS